MLIMDQRNIEIALLREPFIAGTGDLPFMVNRLWKLAGGLVCFCRRGTARVSIDIKEFVIKENTQVLFVPGTIFCINDVSDDFSLSYYCFTDELFHEAFLHMESSFITFLKEYPCFVLPKKSTHVVDGLLHSMAALYADKKNLYRVQMAKHHLQSLLLDVYDKYQRFYSKQETEGSDRQDQLFRDFMLLLHEHSMTEREVAFYAGKLCISPKYLTGICRHVTAKSAKQIIDHFATLQIKVLLQSTELNIAEISDRLNFPDQSYMGRYFKRLTGVSPKEYRTGALTL